MADTGQNSGSFLSPGQPAESRSWLPWVIAGAVAAIGLVLLLLSGSREKARQAAESAERGPDPYASQLAISDLKMSEAENFAGGKVTYVDGTIANKGDKTVTGVTVLVTFHNAVGEPPETTAMPLSLIRTREPYVDIEPVSAEPLQPGASHAFRLIFEHINPAWDQQYPAIVASRVQTRG